MPRCNTAFCISQLPRGQSNPKKLLHPRGKPCARRTSKTTAAPAGGSPCYSSFLHNGVYRHTACGAMPAVRQYMRRQPYCHLF